MSEHENPNIDSQYSPSVWSKLRDELRENIVNAVVTEGVSEDEYLKDIVYEGLSEKIAAAPPIYIQRLDHELGNIKLHAKEEGKRAFIYGSLEDKIAGCVAKGVSEEVALKVFDYMYKAAGYAFNKSHAVSCAVMAYRMSWLRCYYPEEFREAEEEIKAQETKKKQENMGG